MVEKIFAFFDRFEDKARAWLSHRPLLYAFVGGTGVVLFWRGIWHTTDTVMEYYFTFLPANQTVDSSPFFWLDGPLSIVVGLAMLMVSGIFISSFIGNEIIISGINGEKKLVEKTKAEMISEGESINSIKKELRAISRRLKKIEQSLGKN